MARKFYTVVSGKFKKAAFSQQLGTRNFRFKTASQMPLFINQAYLREIDRLGKLLPKSYHHLWKSTFEQNSLEDQMGTVFLCSDLPTQTIYKLTLKPKILIGISVEETAVRDFWIHQHVIKSVQWRMECTIDDIMKNPQGMWPKIDFNDFMATREKVQMDCQGLLNDLVAPAIEYLKQFQKRFVKVTYQPQ